MAELTELRKIPKEIKNMECPLCEVEWGPKQLDKCDTCGAQILAVHRFHKNDFLLVIGVDGYPRGFAKFDSIGEKANYSPIDNFFDIKLTMAVREARTDHALFYSKGGHNVMKDLDAKWSDDTSEWAVWYHSDITTPKQIFEFFKNWVAKAQRVPQKVKKKAPPKLKPASKFKPFQIQSMVYGYIVTHGGEIDIDECTEELEISKGDVEAAIKALKAAGRLEKG